MRAKYIDCGAGQIKLWQAALPDYKLDVDVNTAPFAVEDLPAILDGYDICIDDHTRIPPEVLRECSSLRHFVYFGTGAASILDLPLAEQMGIQVHTIRNYGDTTVAELAAGLVLAAARQIAAQHAVLRQGGWTKMQGMELRGRQIGLVGFGGIGREMARICAGIGLRVAVWNRSGVNDPSVRGMASDELLATSDIVSLHLGLNEDTKGFLSAARIAAMMPGAILVNTARGGLIDEAALVHALDSGHIGHAALDVFATEPLPEDSPLGSAPNVTLTAHCGFWTESATVNQVRLVQGIVQGLQLARARPFDARQRHGARRCPRRRHRRGVLRDSLAGGRVCRDGGGPRRTRRCPRGQLRQRCLVQPGFRGADVHAGIVAARTRPVAGSAGAIDHSTHGLATAAPLASALPLCRGDRAANGSDGPGVAAIARVRPHSARRSCSGGRSARLVRHRGLLYAYPTRAEFEAEALAWRLRRDNGVVWSELDGGRLRNAAPELAPRYGFGALVPAGAHCRDPGAYVAALARQAVRMGAGTARAGDGVPDRAGPVARGFDRHRPDYL